MVIFMYFFIFYMFPINMDLQMFPRGKISEIKMFSMYLYYNWLIKANKY